MGIDDVQPVRLWQSVEASRGASSKEREGELRRWGQRESVVTEAWEYIKSRGGERRSWLTSICPTEQNILYSENNSVGVCSICLWHFCCAYRLDLRWTYIVVGGAQVARSEVSYSFVCRWTSCNFEPGTWMIQLPCPRAQAKTYFHLNVGSSSLSFQKSWFLGASHTRSLSAGMKAKWTKCIQSFKLNKICHFFMYVIQMGEKMQSFFVSTFRDTKNVFTQIQQFSHIRTHMLIFGAGYRTSVTC